MSENEDHTLDLIRRDLKIMKRVCEASEGRVLKSTGDGLLMYFISAISAVKCAIEIQEKITTAALNLSQRDVLMHRIGVHLADMFITDTDVMGNGVNIAARLQAEADPGGICISQTVYEVVKNGLQIATKYLGPRELKNIREVVPAYKILLQPEATDEDNCSITIRNLQENKNSQRIRKLIYYACKNTWESDASKLDSLDLQELVQELIKLAPTLPRLRNFLDAAVKTLSKPAEYTAIANIILTELHRLYPEPEPLDDYPSTQVAVHQASLAAPALESQALYSQIARALETLSNLPRVKKLCYYISRKKWESDANLLNAVPLATLISEVHQAAPNLKHLQMMLDSFVKTLSKSAEYALVANTVVHYLQPLYQPETGSIESATASVEPAAKEGDRSASVEVNFNQHHLQISQALEQEQNLLRVKKLMLYLCNRSWESNAAALNNLSTETLVRQLHQMAPEGQQLEQALMAVVQTLSKAIEYQAIAHTILRHMALVYPDYQPPEPPPISDLDLQPGSTLATPEPPEAASVTAPINLFDTRLDIMRNANPLYAKILLFTALRGEFNFTHQDWLNLKTCDLDGLLRESLNQCESYTDMEDLLYRTARKLPQTDEYVHTATRLIKSLRIFYLHGSLSVALPPSVEDTSIPPGENPDTCLEMPAPTGAEVDDMTCQLMQTIAKPTHLNPSTVLQPGIADADLAFEDEFMETGAIAPNRLKVPQNFTSDPGSTVNGAE
jgi:hypothetical protein